MKTTLREKLLIALWAVTFVAALVDQRTHYVDRAIAADGDTAPRTGSVDSSYDPDRQTTAYRTGVAANDSFTKAYVLGLPRFRCGNRTTLTVGARFSASGQTCTVQVAYVYKTGDPSAATDTDTTINTIKGWSQVVTLTGSSTQKEGGYYEAPDYFFDMGRAVTVRVLVVTKPSSGTVDLWLGS